MARTKSWFYRITTILLVLLMLIPSMNVFAASGASVSVGTATGKSGDQVSVNVSVSGNPGIAYLKLKIGYDSTQLTLKGAQNAGVLSGTFTTSKTTDINPYVLQWMSAENSSGNGVVATLTFQIASNASAGDKAISVSVDECYNENFDDVTLSASNGKVTVNTTTPKVLSSISVSQQPTKTTYFVSESLDTTGLQLKLTYNDSSISYVTSGFTTSGFSSDSVGTKTVTVTYNGKTTTFTVTVKDKTLTSISVSQQPTKTTYFVGESLDTTSLQLKLTYSDGSTSYVTSGFTTSGFSSTSAGTKNVTVSYGGKTTTLSVTVKNKSLTSISVSNQPTKTSYFIGEALDTTGLQLKLNYDDGSTSYVISGFTTSGFSSTSAGTKTVTVTYGGKTTTFSVTVKNKSLTSILVSNPPTKTSYFIGEVLDTTGLQLKLNYDDGSTSYVISGFTASGFSSASAGTKTVTVTYGGKTTTFGVTVKNKSLTSISVSNQPTKTSYFIGEVLDTVGLQLKLNYDDGSTSYATSGFTTSGFSSTSAGTKTVTVFYGGKTTTFAVTVKYKSLASISVNLQDTKRTYFIGEAFDTTDLLLKLTYDDGSTSYVSSGFTISGFSSDSVGTKTVTLTYNGKTTSFNVTVKDKSLTSISVSQQPTKTTYFVGESLDTTGLQLKLTYSDGSTSYVTSGFTTSGFSSTSAGTKNVTVSYGGKTTTLSVTVKNKSLTSISVSNQPTKTSYFIGEALDTTGLQLKLNYDDGSTSYVISGFTTSGFSSTSAGTKTVTVSFGGKTTTFIVTVINKSIEQIKTDISKWNVSGVRNLIYTGKVLKQNNIIVSNNGEYADFSVKYKNNLYVGTATITITGIGDYTGTIIKTFKITKAKNPVTVKFATKTVKLGKVKKSKQTVKPITVSKAQGKVTCKLTSFPKALKKLVKINSKGVITISKWVKAKEGTYKIKAKITAKGNKNYKKGSKTVTVKIKVK